MEVWQIILLSYLGALVVWLIVNALFLLISIIAKQKVFAILEAITGILAVLLSIATGIGDLILVIWLFSQGMWFFAILAIFLGIGIVSFAGKILAAPFIWITGGFSGWYEAIKDHKE